MIEIGFSFIEYVLSITQHNVIFFKQFVYKNLNPWKEVKMIKIQKAKIKLEQSISRKQKLRGRNLSLGNKWQLKSVVSGKFCGFDAKKMKKKKKTKEGLQEKF